MLSPGSNRTSSSRGYSLLEMLVVLGIITVGSAVAIPVTMQMVQTARADSALTMTETFLSSMRNRAIAERRNIVLDFHENSIDALRIEVPSGTQTLIDSLVFENGYRFERGPLPNTPDNFSIAVADAVDFTGDEPVMFTSDGSLLDQAGDVTNGVLFLMKENAAETEGRAVAIWGATGLLRGWKWGGEAWMQ